MAQAPPLLHILQMRHAHAARVIVVCLALGTLAGLAGAQSTGDWPAYGRDPGGARFSPLTQIDTANVARLAVAWSFKTGELGIKVERPANEPRWGGPYLTKAVPPDPWGNAYVFVIPGEHGEYDLLSYGKDGRPGGEGEAADVTNWQ